MTVRRRAITGGVVRLCPVTIPVWRHGFIMSWREEVWSDEMVLEALVPMWFGGVHVEGATRR